jgi:uncharacterized protein (DUF2141 family)
VSLVLAFFGLLAAADAAPATEIAPSGRRVAVTVGGFRSSAGSLRVKLVSEADGFPGSDEHVAAKRRVRIDGARVRVAFEAVAAGDYAVVALHDEDDDAALDRTFLGLPTEGLGFSNGARVRFGPPSFADARFALGAEDAEIAIELQYDFLSAP